MPIPNSILGSVLPDLSVVPDGVFPSLMTLRPMVTSRDGAGQIKHTFADSTNPVQIGLACRLSPLIQIRPQDQENQKSGDERAMAKYQLNLASYVNVQVQTLLKWQVKVDGAVYQILSVESDGNKLTTRMMLADVNQFEA